MPQTEQYPISDLLTWMDEKTLVLNTEFQRRSVWPPSARTYLIDTILRDRPMPSIYVRTKTDLKTRRAYREVVDGQQRLNTIHEFASGKLVLGKEAKEFEGKNYEDLDAESKTSFLVYQIGVVQLFNAPDEEVLDIFHRINAYGLSLNHQELRHGKFQGAFRTSVTETSKRWAVLWEEYHVVGLRDRVRMADDELMAQMFGVVLRGVQDGGQPKINKLYEDYDNEVPAGTVETVDAAIEFLVSQMGGILKTGLARAPHFLMLFSAVAHGQAGIPTGDIEEERMPARDPSALTDLDMAKANLGILADVLAADIEDIPVRFHSFKLASAGTTQRIKSRTPRFLMLYKALLSEPL